VKHRETSNTQQKGDMSNSSKKDHMNKPSSKPQGTGMELKNSFASLDNDKDNLWDQGIGIGLLIVLCALKGHELYWGGMRILLTRVSLPKLSKPWCILGDFNDALNLEDSSVGSSFLDILMREFKECVEEIELMDVPRSGL
ncbi:RNA-directed DNA polymerase, eukaryota, reverse transcriptase zinc-binding domain protein, partial [Tanacetum coccineum]